MRRILLSFLMLALCSGAAVSAKGPPMLNGSESQQRVSKLSAEINWYRSLPQALEESRRTGKPVVWIHMLGQIDGAT